MPDLVVGHDARNSSTAFDLPPESRNVVVHGPPSHAWPTLGNATSGNRLCSSERAEIRPSYRCSKGADRFRPCRSARRRRSICRQRLRLLSSIRFRRSAKRRPTGGVPATERDWKPCLARGARGAFRLAAGLRTSFGQSLELATTSGC
jgi:hypothetical protein